MLPCWCTLFQRIRHPSVKCANCSSPHPMLHNLCFLLSFLISLRQSIWPRLPGGNLIKCSASVLGIDLWRKKSHSVSQIQACLLSTGFTDTKNVLVAIIFACVCMWFVCLAVPLHVVSNSKTVQSKMQKLHCILSKLLIIICLKRKLSVQH